jgi:outer membrane protein OmpA-like peptidoglycan-associated protein
MWQFPPAYQLAIFFVFGYSALWSQNLVKNPSFESFRHCPDQLGNFHADVSDWSSPTLASTDYFNACSSSMGTPENFNGFQAADHGVGYAGLYLYAPGDYREYMQGELLETLQEGITYEISFFISLAERSDYAVSEIGLVFSMHKLHRPIKKELSKMQLYKENGNAFSFVRIPHSGYFNDTAAWIRLKAEFTATGRENFVTIGNFENNARTRTFRTSRNAKQGAYYYIDMVRIQPADITAEALSADQPAASETYSLDTEHLFRNVLFDFNDFRLRPEAKTELRRLYDYLRLHNDLNITINGHTDNIGTADYNLRLSGQRCKAVTSYLLRLGLGAERITWISHGFDQPVADNASEEGRSKNRRVAFSLTRAVTN